VLLHLLVPKHKPRAVLNTLNCGILKPIFSGCDFISYIVRMIKELVVFILLLLQLVYLVLFDAVVSHVEHFLDVTATCEALVAIVALRLDLKVVSLQRSEEVSLVSHVVLSAVPCIVFFRG
jgi:hypothetical protein